MPGLEFRDIRKAFGAVHALNSVSFAVAEGELHAIVGENGAGKSTLLKVLAGLVRPDSGEILWRDARFSPASPREAIELGVGIVYQEMLSFPNLSVSGNIFAGRELTTFGRLREAEMRDRTRALLAQLHVDIDPDLRADALSAAHRQLLQVARAVAFQCRILVLDEPTTALTDAEAEHLFEVLRELKRKGTTLLYVSHRLPEVFRLCDRMTVLRDGSLVGTFGRAETSPDQIVKAMVGRELIASSTGAGDAARTQAKEVAGLELRGLSRPPGFRDISLTVARGEVVALFGLVGSGRSELLETVFGMFRAASGEIRIDARVVHLPSPQAAARAGVALVPEERQRQGLFFNLDVRHNLLIPRQSIRTAALVDAAEERREAERLLREWRIKAPSLTVTPDGLSGGNQQKVVVAKWLTTNPRILLLDEPTKGVDVGAKFEIHAMIRREAAAGLAVLLASSDLPEVLALADRVIVMREGRIQGALAAAKATEEAVMHLATSELSNAS